MALGLKSPHLWNGVIASVRSVRVKQEKQWPIKHPVHGSQLHAYPLHEHLHISRDLGDLGRRVGWDGTIFPTLVCQRPQPWGTWKLSLQTEALHTPVILILYISTRIGGGTAPAVWRTCTKAPGKDGAGGVAVLLTRTGSYKVIVRLSIRNKCISMMSECPLYILGLFLLR